MQDLEHGIIYLKNMANMYYTENCSIHVFCTIYKSKPVNNTTFMKFHDHRRMNDISKATPKKTRCVGETCSFLIMIKISIYVPLLFAKTTYVHTCWVVRYVIHIDIYSHSLTVPGSLITLTSKTTLVMAVLRAPMEHFIYTK